MLRFAVFLLASLIMTSCSRHAQPPTGRWIGNFESPNVMVDARLEVERDGSVRVSAPDLLDVGSPSDEDRTAMRARLASDLAEAWDAVAPRQMDFDGRVFRKPGGVAPQMEWDRNTQQMKLVFYFGMQHSIRISLRRVQNFSRDPWAS
jgi:hypothetical protein